MGKGPFASAAATEATHTEAVRLLIDRYDLADPAPSATVGIAGNPTFSHLYQEFVTTGSASYVGALKIGAHIEELNIKDLKARSSTPPEFASVFAELEGGSRNHLRAFVRQIERHGAQYATTHITQAEFDLIVSGAVEPAGPR